MVILFEPIYKQTIWGGNRLHEEFGYSCSKQTGEAWGIAAHKNGNCIIKNTNYQGQSLSQLWENHPELFGNHPSQEFPILVKIIDAKDDLSIQVHPDNEYASKLNSFGKKECWYILQADKDTEIIIGHHAKTYDEFLSYVENDDYEHLLQSFKIEKGDFFYINAGTIHAICKNTLLLEVQQSSDITYRFFDYHRKYEGKERELHLKEALEVVRIPDHEISKKLYDTPFDVNFENISTTKQIKNHPHGIFFALLDGECIVNNTSIKKGDFGFIDATEKEIMIEGSGQVAWIYLENSTK